MPPETVIEISQDTEAHHARKQRNIKNSQKQGVLLVKRDGYTAYIEYCKPYAVEYFPSIEGGSEKIECRSGDSAWTVHGRNLWVMFKDLQVKQCDAIRESPHPHVADSGVPLVETVTVRMWA